jgi:hypothetical protein
MVESECWLGARSAAVDENPVCKLRTVHWRTVRKKKSVGNSGSHEEASQVCQRCFDEEWDKFLTRQVS